VRCTVSPHLSGLGPTSGKPAKQLLTSSLVQISCRCLLMLVPSCCTTMRRTMRGTERIPARDFTTLVIPVPVPQSKSMFMAHAHARACVWFSRGQWKELLFGLSGPP